MAPYLLSNMSFLNNLGGGNNQQGVWMVSGV